jgi:hypothetical protein
MRRILGRLQGSTPEASQIVEAALRWMLLTVMLFFPAWLHAQEISTSRGYIQGHFTNQGGSPDRLELRRIWATLSPEYCPEVSYTFRLIC